MDVVGLLALVVASISCLATLALYAEVGRLSLRLNPERSQLPLIPDEGLTPGTIAPNRWLPNREDQATLVLFLSEHCGPCKQLWNPLVEFGRFNASHLQVVAIVSEPPDEFARTASNIELVVDADGSLARDFDVRRTPFAYFLTGRTVRSRGVVNTIEQVASLMAGHAYTQNTPWVGAS
jgi:thiol-disulfide isomerase/thioredoxin